MEGKFLLLSTLKHDFFTLIRCTVAIIYSFWCLILVYQAHFYVLQLVKDEFFDQKTDLYADLEPYWTSE